MARRPGSKNRMTPAKRRRAEIIEEVKRKDAARRGLVHGSATFKEARRAEAERKRAKVKAGVCCKDKYDLPQLFRPCVDCPRVQVGEA